MASLALSIGLMSSLNRAEEVIVPSLPISNYEDGDASSGCRSTDSSI